MFSTSDIRRLVLAGLTAAVLSGCGSLGMMMPGGGSGDAAVSSDARSAARAAAKTTPDLKPGDRFTFDNPSVTWTVSAVDGDRVSWRADNGETQTTLRNPLLPALEWTSADRGNGTRLISGLSQPMFPLESGKEVTFRATVDSDAPPYAWEYDWRCEIGGLEAVSVPGGDFVAFRIGCGRTQPDELIMFYAPEVGNYVRLVVADPNGGPTLERRLTGFMRAGGMMEAVQPVAPGAVAVESEMPNQTDLSFSDTDTGIATVSETADEGGPTALGMIAESSASMSEAPTAAPESGLTDAQPAEMRDATPSLQGLSVHLASYKDPDNAESGWKQLMSAHRDLLDGTRPIVRRVDLAGKGIFYRLHAGPIQDQGAAETLCRTLTQRGVYCKIARF